MYVNKRSIIAQKLLIGIKIMQLFCLKEISNHTYDQELFTFLGNFFCILRGKKVISLIFFILILLIYPKLVDLSIANILKNTIQLIYL